MTNTTENHAVRLHVDRGVLRDIIEARIVQDKRRSYYTIGSVFSGMGFTLVAMGSTNYTAASLFVMLGVFYYLCIVGANVNYVAEEEEGAGAKFQYYGEDTDDDIAQANHADHADSEEEEDDGVEFTNLSSLTRSEKMLLFRTLFEELSGIDIQPAELRQLLHSEPRAPAPSVAEESVRSESEGEVSTETIVTEGPRLARAETYYSQTESVPSVEAVAPVEAVTPVEAVAVAEVEVIQPAAAEPINLDAEEESGAATPESSSDVN